MGTLDHDALEVQLSAKEAVYGAREWWLTSSRARVGVARRRKGIGTALSGLRHRLPIDLLDADGSVLCTVRRSRAIKGSANLYRLVGTDGVQLGAMKHSSRRNDEGRMEFLVDIHDGDGELVASKQPPPDESHGPFVGTESGWSVVRCERSPNDGGWTTPVTWRVTGVVSHRAQVRALRILTDTHLTVCHSLTRETGPLRQMPRRATEAIRRGTQGEIRRDRNDRRPSP